MDYPSTDRIPTLWFGSQVCTVSLICLLLAWKGTSKVVSAAGGRGGSEEALTADLDKLAQKKGARTRGRS